MCDDFDEESINDLDIDKRYLENQLCEYEKLILFLYKYIEILCVY
jgi:hypothetical protein